mmetsp:Transcript_16144/g.29035  ORF Transcript_16144/g.29035 Transcript_16144/m.29035 type:complete len:306 (+) Transcript_16144:68-985(+)
MKAPVRVSTGVWLVALALTVSVAQANWGKKKNQNKGGGDTQGPADPTPPHPEGKPPPQPTCDGGADKECKIGTDSQRDQQHHLGAGGSGVPKESVSVVSNKPKKSHADPAKKKEAAVGSGLGDSRETESHSHSHSHSQSEPKDYENFWAEVSHSRLKKMGVELEDGGETYYLLDYNLAFDEVHQKNLPSIPIPYFGQIVQFELQDSGKMPKVVADKYPEIRSFLGSADIGEGENSKAEARIDMNAAGINAIIKGPSGSYYVDPVRGSPGKSVSHEGLLLHKAHIKSDIADDEEKGHHDSPLRHST